MSYLIYFLSALMSTSALAAETSLTDAQKKEVQSVVHDYLVNQPEVLIEASQSLQKKQQARLQEEVQKAVKSNASEVFKSPLSTVGDVKGNVTLVEFFDYQCGHCKQMAPVMLGVTKQSPTLRVVYKELPIFGGESLVAAKAALAAGMQNKYLAMHDALLQSTKKLTNDVVFELAQKVKLDLAQLKKDMESTAVTNELQANRKLAETLQLMGTPAFIIAATPKGVYQQSDKPVMFVPGAASEAALLEMIQKTQHG